jgi:uncharacterized protein (TIGR03437 family)
MPLKSLLAVSSILISCVTANAQIAPINTLPSREVGQPTLPRPNPLAVTSQAPNLVEGRELFLPSAVALDTTASPPILYVADFGNSRVMAWKNAAAFANGKPADLIIGQKDQYSTNPNGPGVSTFTTGLSQPTGLAVLNGDLYVADTGNNRVLRFRAPFSAPAGQQQFPDLCLGQPSFQSNTANAPNGLITDKALSAPGALRFDKNGNLWVADTGNNRVLQYQSADIAKPAIPFAISAKLEIGQLDMNSKGDPLSLSDAQVRVNQLQSPTAIAFDSTGRLYLGDAGSQISRVLVFQPNFTNGMGASRMMGIPQPQPQGVVTPDPQLYSVLIGSVSDIFFLPGTQGIGIVDAGLHRIMMYDVYENWPDPATAISPSAKSIIGHTSGVIGINSKDGKSLVANDGNATSSAGTFSVPQSGLFFNNELYVADAGNNRVIVLPYSNNTLQPAVRLLGQDRYDSNAPNLIEGREFDFQASSNGQRLYDAGLAVDSTGDTPHLYVADPYNNRVLGFKDLRKLAAGSAADIVIGQPDFATNVCNFGSPDRNTPSQTGLCRPMGVQVDSAGNLYVADALNGRVVRFPSPFSHGNNQVADVVLGQPSFFLKVTDPSSSTMGFPYGIAFTALPGSQIAKGPNNGIFISDQAYSRVLFIPFTNGDFTAADNGKAATKVLGQKDFVTVTSGTSDTAFNSPRHVATDSDGRPYVADSGNSRILIFDQVARLPNSGAHPVQTLAGQTGPVTGIYVSQVTGEVWTADLTRNRIVKFPKFDTLVFNPAPVETDIQAIVPIALTQDQYGDLIVAEGTNRVTLYFPGLSALNGANFSLKSTFLAPNALGALYPAVGGTFGKDTADLSSVPNPLPVPKLLGDVQVLFDGVACPLYYASPGQINFLVPWDAQTGPLPSEIEVIQVSTGRVLASGLIPMNTVSPGILYSSAVTSTQVQGAVLNQDGTPNSATHPAARGEIVSIFATGQGFLQGHPADGENPASPISTDPSTVNVRVVVGACFLDTCQVQPTEKVLYPNFLQYSGTTAYPGLWQINVQIPQVTDPSKPVPIGLVVNGYTSNGGSIGTPTPVIFVK